MLLAAQHGSAVGSSAVTLQELIREAIGIYGTGVALSARTGIDRSRISRLASGASGPNDSLDSENLLRLAKVVGRSGSEVLRIGGKSDYADLIEELYGEESTRAVSDDEWAIIQRLRKQSPAKRRILLELFGLHIHEAPVQHSPPKLGKRSAKRKAG